MAQVNPILGLVASLTAGCFGDSGDMELRWTISGSVNTRDETLDRCDEVGAASLRLVTTRGPADLAPRVVPCDNGRGQYHLLDDIERGSWSIEATLLDAEGRTLTGPANTAVEVTERQGLGRLDFAPETFVDPAGQPLVRHGTYRFRLGYARPASDDDLHRPVKSCTRLGPPRPVGQRVRLLDTSGQPVVAEVCAAGRCAAADGSAELPCVGWELEQSIGPLPWGSYDISFSGIDAERGDCWTGSNRIVVGAGDNPVVEQVATLQARCVAD